jgi:hypothetical protein
LAYDQHITQNYRARVPMRDCELSLSMSALACLGDSTRTPGHGQEVPELDMRSWRASAAGPADGCSLGVKRGAGDLRDGVPKQEDCRRVS